MKVKLKTISGALINIYQVHHLKEFDDRIILYGEPVAYINGECKNGLMLIGLEELPGTPIATPSLTIWRSSIKEIVIK